MDEEIAITKYSYIPIYMYRGVVWINPYVAMILLYAMILYIDRFNSREVG